MAFFKHIYYKQIWNLREQHVYFIYFYIYLRIHFSSTVRLAHLLFQSLPAEGWVHIEYEDDAVIWESWMSPVIIPKPRLQSVKEKTLTG